MHDIMFVHRQCFFFIQMNIAQQKQYMQYQAVPIAEYGIPSLQFNCQRKICKPKPVGNTYRKFHRKFHRFYSLYKTHREAMLCHNERKWKIKIQRKYEKFNSTISFSYLLHFNTYYKITCMQVGILAEILSQCHLRLICDVLVFHMFCSQN